MATDLFTPIRLGGLELPNRIVMAPLTRNRAGQPGNVPQPIAAIAAGRADCVAFGKSYIANPDLVERYAQDALLNVANPGTFYGGREQGYTDYPALTGDHVAPSQSQPALSLRRQFCLTPLSQLGPIPAWREPA